MEERWVFVTSALYQGDLGGANANPDLLTGLDLADKRCNDLAAALKPPLPGTYKAWLSDDTGAPATRFDTDFAGFYRLRSEGFPVVAAEGWIGLTSGKLEHPIDADESGSLLDNQSVWTNTAANGTNLSNEHCVGWTEPMGVTTVGKTSQGDQDDDWTDFAKGQLCSGNNRLYCFQDP
jgi:hypothetical protein